MPDLENDATVQHFDVSKVSSVWSETMGLEHKDITFTLSINDCANNNLKQNGTGQVMVEGVVAEEKWAKHYSSYHKILLVGEGDFSFSASLAAAFGSASKLTATSLDSKKVLRKDYDKAVHHIEELKRKGCKVIYGLDATAMASHPSLKGLTFDRIIFNFPYAVIPKNGSRKPQLWRHQSLVKGYLKTAKEMIRENGEIHITHRTDGVFDAWRIELIASQQGLELVEAVDFNICDYPDYNPKWGIGSDDNFECFPSKTYKFRHPYSPLKILSFVTTEPACSTVDDAPIFPNNNISQCVEAASNSRSIDTAIGCTAPFKLGVENGINTHDKDFEIFTKLLEAIGLEQKGIYSPPSSNYCANRNLKQNEMGQEMDNGVVAEEKWVKHYSSSHKMLLVGEGDFSFSASLASAFGSAHNMIATSLDSKKFVSENHSEAVSNMEELKRTGCTMIFGVDATCMAHHPLLMGLTFDRIIFNFPYAIILENDSRKDILWRHQALVRGFLKTAKQMIDENGEIHITHRTDGLYSAWRIKFIASQLGLELVEAVDFNICDYLGYNAKWGTGSDTNFECFPSKTYKFQLPHPALNVLSCATLPEPASRSSVPNFPTTGSNFDVADLELLLNLSEHSEESCYDFSESETVELDPKEFIELDQEDITSPSSKHYLMHKEEVQQDIMKGVVAEEKWAKHYSSYHKILLVGEGDFSFSASLAATFGSAANVTATSLDSLEFLKTNYCLSFLHLKELKRRGCKVMHGVDATCMAHHPCLMGLTFDRIIFNFPFAGFFKNKPRIFQIRCHQTLVREFLANAKQMIGENGEIHITHKTNGFHQEWNIVSLADQQGLEHVDSVDFNVSDYPGYSNKFGFGGDNSFDFFPSQTYMFGLPRPWTYRCIGWD